MASDPRAGSPKTSGEPSVSAKAAELSRSAPTQAPYGFAAPKVTPLSAPPCPENVTVNARPAPTIVAPDTQVPDLRTIAPARPQKRDPSQAFQTDGEPIDDLARDPRKPFISYSAKTDLAKLPPPTGRPISPIFVDRSAPATMPKQKAVTVGRSARSTPRYQTRYRRRQP